MKKVLIVGGGIVGQFIGYYLSSKEDYEITIIDDNPSMPPASAGNCGLITPSHIEPLNSFSTLLQGMKWLGKKDAPLAIRPQLNPAFIKWFLSFIWYSRKSHLRKAVDVRHKLLQSSWVLYNEYFSKENSTCEFQPKGLVYASNTSSGFEKQKREVELLMKHDLSCEILSKESLLALEPSLTDQVVGGSILRVDGCLRPDKLLEEIRSINAKNGVEQISSKVKGFGLNKHDIQCVQTDNNEIDADKFILAAGAQSYHLAKKIGISLPMIPGKGYNLTYPSRLEDQPKFPIFMFEKKVAATPWENGFRLGSTLEFAGFDLSLNQSRLDALKKASKEYLKTDVDRVEPTPWAGWRPMTSSSVPIIRPSEKHRNLILATGHGMLGLSLAPATGQLVAGLVDSMD